MKVKSKFVVAYRVNGEDKRKIINARNAREAATKFKKLNLGKAFFVYPMFISAKSADRIWDGKYVLLHQNYNDVLEEW